MARSARVLGATSAETSRTTREWAVSAAARICRETGTEREKGERRLKEYVIVELSRLLYSPLQSPILRLQMPISLRQLGHCRAQFVQLASTTESERAISANYRTCTQGVVLARST
ncbi:hypothetical protein PENTCL1PPCAC_25823, partial [Pristionchus entomophagus]